MGDGLRPTNRTDRGCTRRADVLPDAIARFVSSKIDLEKAGRITITYFTVVEKRWFASVFTHQLPI